ncbi:DUF411 domain-containing protein [uncultured Hoeflea sp.]|uniref:DUF411 domain-containing protein n=1 Tax=uncultured Hoeflea sp. TaxID=538666 RepID=UPI002638FDFE|nr:DUF411 domain-containing protein [uncultured Hoeflea sp.]
MTKTIKFALAAFVAAAALPLPTQAADGAGEQHIMVFKTPWCGCCQSWVDAMKGAGYTVDTQDLEDLTAIKKQAGVTSELEACHTAVIGGERKYTLEGHVPIEAVEKLMSERPDIRGIATPGMPMGSLGMGYDPEAKYEVYAFSGRSGETPTLFHRAGEE